MRERRIPGSRTPGRSGHVRLAVAVLAVALIGVACGGDDRLSKEEYEQQLDEIGNEFATTIQEVFSAPELQNPDSLGQAADIIRDGQQVIADAADEMAALNPPEEVQEQHDKLVEGFRDLAADLGTFADDAEEGNLSAIEQFAQDAQSQSLPSFQKIQEAIDEFAAKGYGAGPG
jgi:hypothetical protein